MDLLVLFAMRLAAVHKDDGRGMVPALRQEFGVAGGYGGPGEELLVSLVAALNKVRANGMVGKDFY